jgi:hypothetical protein
MTNLKFKKNWRTADVNNKRSDCWRCFGISAIKSITRFGSVRFLMLSVRFGSVRFGSAYWEFLSVSVRFGSVLKILVSVRFKFSKTRTDPITAIYLGLGWVESGVAWLWQYWLWQLTFGNWQKSCHKHVRKCVLIETEFSAIAESQLPKSVLPNSCFPFSFGKSGK